MTINVSSPVQILTVEQLQPGDEIEARRNQTVYHRGPVQELMPALGVVWILDSRTGTRKLLEVAEWNMWLVTSPRRPADQQLPTTDIR